MNSEDGKRPDFAYIVENKFMKVGNAQSRSPSRNDNTLNSDISKLPKARAKARAKAMSKAKVVVAISVKSV